jgi:uncharacterized protein YbjT (DUF2867 family)
MHHPKRPAHQNIEAEAGQNKDHLMKNKPVLLLGGYGRVGRSLARLLLKETGAEVIIAGRQKEKADELASSLRQEFPGKRVFSRYADASDRESLLKAFQGVQLIRHIIYHNTPALVAISAAMSK